MIGLKEHYSDYFFKLGITSEKFLDLTYDKLSYELGLPHEDCYKIMH